MTRTEPRAPWLLAIVPSQRKRIGKPLTAADALPRIGPAARYEVELVALHAFRGTHPSTLPNFTRVPRNLYNPSTRYSQSHQTHLFATLIHSLSYVVRNPLSSKSSKRKMDTDTPIPVPCGYGNDSIISSSSHKSKRGNVVLERTTRLANFQSQNIVLRVILNTFLHHWRFSVSSNHNFSLRSLSLQ